MISIAFAAAGLAVLAAQPGTLEGMIADRLSGRPGAGMVIATADGPDTTVRVRGQAGLDAGTAFDVSGLADVFIAVALADMVAKGEVALGDPVARHLAGVVMPTRGGKSITLEDLVMHRAALPRLLPGLKRPQATAFGAYTRERLAEFLASYELPRDIGERYERSHLGTALLAAALAARAGTSLEQLLEARVFAPLGMGATRMEAGVLHSTAADLVTFLTANMRDEGPLGAVLADTRASRGHVGAPREGLGLGWRIRSEGPRQLLWASGSAGGQQAFIAIEPDARRAAVVLHNEPLSVDDLGFRALQEIGEAATPVDAPPLAPFAGEYEVRRGFVIVVRVEGRKLVARVGEEPESPLTQDSELRFVFDYAEARITFIRDAGGAPIGLMLHRGGQHIGARKVR